MLPRRRLVVYKDAFDHECADARMVTARVRGRGVDIATDPVSL